ncbi:MAG: ketopantoate reductase family protein [Actinomycetaceae bacterium]|nr:ketopantoate reductase family protein [Actinomycetaceae bacterium]
MTYAVVGTGGVGALCAAALSRGGADVACLTTPRHVEPLTANGLVIETGQGDYEAPVKIATANAHDIGPVNAVIVAVKLYQLDDVIASLSPLLTPETLIVSLLNGIEAPSRLAEAYPSAHVVPGITTMVSTLIEPGRARSLGPVPGLQLADHALDGTGSEQIARLVDSFDSSLIRAFATSDIDHLLWRKFALITTFGGVCALADAPIGAVRENPGTRALIDRSLAEARSVATAAGVNLSEDDIEGIVSALMAMDPDSTTSLQRDIAQGKRGELDGLNGRLVERAHALGIDVAFHETVCAVLDLRLARSASALVD